MTRQPTTSAVDAHDFRRSARTRQVGLALAMLIAPWLIVVANVGDAIMKLDGGGDDTTPRDALDLAAAHLTLDRWSNFSALIGSLLLVPAVLGVMRVLRPSAARLSLIGGCLMIAGYICYFGIVFQGTTADAMVEVGGSSQQNIEVLQAGLDEPLNLWVYLLFVLGNFVGTFLLGLALVRSRGVPRFAGFGLMAWPVFHLLGLPGFEAVGAVLQGVGFAIVALVLLRQQPVPPTESRPDPYELLRR
jgi:hypothetical protein